MINRHDVTERIISRSRLTRKEAKIIRVRYNLPTAGKKSRRWVESLSPRKYRELLVSGIEKIEQAIKGAGK